MAVFSEPWLLTLRCSISPVSALHAVALPWCDCLAEVSFVPFFWWILRNTTKIGGGEAAPYSRYLMYYGRSAASLVTELTVSRIACQGSGTVSEGREGEWKNASRAVLRR